MKKLVAVLCVVALMMMAIPAFANPSVAVPVIPTTEGVVVDSLDSDDLAGDNVNAKAKAAIEGVNGEGYLTPTEVVQMVFGPDATEELAEVENYSFTSQFNKISAPEFPIDVEFEGTDENTKFMLIDPEVDETLVIILRNEDGSYTFPFAGFFAMMDPTPKA